MDHFIDIYTSRARDYHQMIGPEDTDGNLLPALERVTPLAGRRIVDLGSGTGRLPILLHHLAGTLIAVDLFADMLREQQRQRRQHQGQWPLLQADMHHLPLNTGWADVITAGWAIGHFVGWYGPAWQAEVQQVLTEMHRVVKPGGALIVMETLTTGSKTPAPPTAGLARFYGWLEDEWGFNRQVISTDYQFANLDEAVARTEFFFGAPLANQMRIHGWTRLPEWTGVWGKIV